MQSPFVAGLLAYGMSGRIFHAPFLTAHPGFKLKAVMERTHKHAAQHYPDIVTYNSIADILADDEIQLIVVNSPSHFHYEQAKQALQAGKHVLVEKPVAATVAQVDELYALAKQVNRHLFVYQNRRWDSDFLSVKEVIESGRLGRLTEVQFRYDRYRMEPSPKIAKEDPALPTSGIVYDLGPHLLDQMISLFGKPLESHKLTARQRDNTLTDDYFSYQMIYPGQLVVGVSAGLLVPQQATAFVVHGAKGSYHKVRCDVQEGQLDKAIKPTDSHYGIEPANLEGTLTTIDESGQKHTEKIAAHKGNYMQLFEAVYQTLANDVPYPITEDHIRWQVALLQAK